MILHYTAMDCAEAARDWLCAPESGVSAHYLIAADGRVWHMVDENERAWHAGEGSWQGRDDVNSWSIGIELDNDGETPFAEALMATLEGILLRVMTQWQIPRDCVLGHSDIAPGRKRDPGPLFDWRRLAGKGLARPTPTPAPVSPRPERSFRDLARLAGYTADAPDDAILRALRDRHAPGREGPAGPEDFALLAALA